MFPRPLLISPPLGVETRQERTNRHVVVLSPFYEYTEEIERLRRDLAATREKNGVYMDEGEYTRLTVKLASLESENAEKYANIKALREEMQKMEDLCSVLNMEVNEKKSELIQTTELLTETEDCLERTKSILVATEMENKLKEHLVSYHENKEQLLSEQAHSLMSVADQSTTDALRLHDKLSRKRSVEEGNRSRGEQFRNKFRRNVSNMEGSLDKLISEHAAFCGNLRTTLGDLQEQKTSELTIMSEHLTRQVQLFMDLLHGMEQKSAEAVRNAQHWIQTHLGYIRSKGTSVEDLRTSLVALIEPPLQGISEQLRGAVMDMQVLSNDLNDRIRDRGYQLEVYSLETKDALNGIEESVAHYVAQRKQESERFDRVRRNMIEDSEAENEEMLSQLRVLAETVQRLEERTQARKLRTNQSDAELRDGLNHTDSLTESMAGEVQKAAGSLKKKLSKYVVDEKQTSEELQSMLREFVEKRTVAVSHMEHLRDEAMAGCWSALSSHEEERMQYYQSTEEQLRDHSEMLKGYLVDEHEQTQTLAAKVREMAEVQESHLESQRRSFRSFMQQRQEDLAEECSVVRGRGQILSDELKRRQVEMGLFFSNEYMDDHPTGETPPRREYVYPRKLVLSSPKEIVIKRLKAQLDSVEVAEEKRESDQLQKKGNFRKLSRSTTSLPMAVAEPLLDTLPASVGLVKAASETNVPSVADNSNFDDEAENQENMKVLKVGKVKSRLREPKMRSRLRAPLLEKNDD